jgi:hypothetical protein
MSLLVYLRHICILLIHSSFICFFGGGDSEFAFCVWWGVRPTVIIALDWTEDGG